MDASFVISLDFELMWGLHDSRHARSKVESAEGARQAIPRILELFERYGISATWATVGLLWCESRGDMLECLEATAGDDPGHYTALQNYVREFVGLDPSSDPLHFGGDLPRQIAGTPGQEIASHSFSHYCCLDPGAVAGQFLADIETSCQLASRQGVALRSLVFPRNQVERSTLSGLRNLGIEVYRGTPDVDLYRQRASRDQGPALRAARLLDSILPLCQGLDFEVDGGALPRNVPASRFLRPWSPAMGPLYPLQRRRIRSEMSLAARTQRSYHLWWHPHNFGRYTERQLRELEMLLQHYRQLRDDHGWCSAGMADLAAMGGS